MQHDNSDVRMLLVNTSESFTRDILRLVAKRYRMSEDALMQKYMKPYYYMPIVESTLEVVASGVHKEAAGV